MKEREEKCCRKGDPFQGPKGGSGLTFRNELSEETNMLTKQKTLSHVGFLTLLLSAWALLPNKVFCFVSMFVSSDNSFLNVRPEPPFGP